MAKVTGRFQKTTFVIEIEDSEALYILEGLRVLVEASPYKKHEPTRKAIQNLIKDLEDGNGHTTHKLRL